MGWGVINQGSYTAGVCEVASAAHVFMHLSELAVNDLFMKTEGWEESSLPSTQDTWAISGEM